MNVLLIVDDADTREALSGLLRDHGHDIAVCSDGFAGWWQYQRSPSPLVLVDWSKSEVDAYQLCRMIRGRPEGPGSVIVGLVPRDYHDRIGTLVESGADDFVLTPLETGDWKTRLEFIEERAARCAGLPRHA